MYTLSLARIPENLHWIPRARGDVLGVHSHCISWTMTGRLSYVAAYEEYADNFEWFAVEPLDGDVREGLARVRQHLDAPHLVDLDEPLYAVTLPNRGDEWRTKFSDGTGGGRRPCSVHDFLPGDIVEAKVKVVRGAVGPRFHKSHFVLKSLHLVQHN